MDAGQMTLELAMDARPAFHAAACSAIMWDAGKIILTPGKDWQPIEQWNRVGNRYLVRDRNLSKPKASASAEDKAFCWHWSFACLLGATLDCALYWWPCEGINGEEVYPRLQSFGVAADYYATEKPKTYVLCWAKNLQWPVCGFVAVRLPDGDLHWLATLNGEVFDSLIGRVITVEEWHAANMPYEITELLIVAPRVLGRDFKWLNDQADR